MNATFRIDRDGHLHISGYEIEPNDPCDGRNHDGSGCDGVAQYVALFDILTGTDGETQGAAKLCAACADQMALTENADILSIDEARGRATQSDHSELGKRGMSERTFGKLDRVLRLIDEAPHVTSETIAKRFNISRTLATNWVSVLLKLGKIETCNHGVRNYREYRRKTQCNE